MDDARGRYLAEHIGIISREVRHGLQAIPQNFEGIQAITAALDSFEHYALLDPRSRYTETEFRNLRQLCTRFRANVYPEMLEAGFRAIQNTPIAEEDARERERVNRAYYEQMRGEYARCTIDEDGIDWSQTTSLRPPRNDEAEKRGMDLLRDNLSENQRNELEQHGWFHVIGNSSKKTYRLHKARQLNILRYDRSGLPEACYCFLPSNGVVLGDVLLGQKLALETDEKKTLRIANKFGPEVCREAWRNVPAGAAVEGSPGALRPMNYGIGILDVLRRRGLLAS